MPTVCFLPTRAGKELRTDKMVLAAFFRHAQHGLSTVGCCVARQLHRLKASLHRRQESCYLGTKTFLICARDNVWL